MPVIKSAIKKLRKDRKKTKENSSFLMGLEKSVKAAQKTATQKTVSAAFSSIDKAAKKNLIHKNKAARLKASLSKLLLKKAPTVKTEKVVKTTKTASAKKPASKKTIVK